VGLSALVAPLVVGSTVASGATTTPRFSGFVVEGANVPSDLSTAPSAVRTAVLTSAQNHTIALADGSGGFTYEPASPAAASGAPAPNAVQPASVASGYHLPGGTMKSPYVWQQTSNTTLGIVDNSSGKTVEQVNLTFKESITGNSSDYWAYSFAITQVKGDAWSLDVSYKCVVNEKNANDEYCTSITYPDGKKDSADVTPSHTQTVHSTSTGGATNGNVTGFFGTKSTPPPSGSSQIIKFAQLGEYAYFPTYGLEDYALIRTYDVCVPKKSTFSGVTLCSSSGTGN
jgi:hypothetical protein